MLIVLLITSLIVIVVVLIHYQVLGRLLSFENNVRIKPKLRVAFGLLGALFAHIIEVWVFAFAYYFLLKFGQLGSLQGAKSDALMDCVYFSFISYTSLGYGDIVPLGAMRFLAGMEALVGLVLISWTASFMYVQMERFWLDDAAKG